MQRIERTGSCFHFDILALISISFVSRMRSDVPFALSYGMK